MSDNTNSAIYKITGKQEWSNALRSGSFRGSPDDLRDGFIHFSTRDQLAGTARKHFFGRDDLLLIALDPASLGPALKWEPSRGGALFPHLYADFATTSAVWVRELKLRADGEPDINAALEEPIP